MKKPLVIIILFALLGVALFLYMQTKDTRELPPEIYEQFGCDRISLDLRSTDIYCSDSELWWDTAADKYGY